MPDFGSIIRFATDFEPEVLIDGEVADNITFALPAVIAENRPGFPIQVKQNGAAISAGAAITGTIAAGTVVQFGNATHVLARPIDFATRTEYLFDSAHLVHRFGSSGHEVLTRGFADDAAIRAALRLFGCLTARGIAEIDGRYFTAPARTVVNVDALRGRFDTSQIARHDLERCVDIDATAIGQLQTFETIGFSPYRPGVPSASFWNPAKASTSAFVYQVQSLSMVIAQGFAVAVLSDLTTQEWAADTPVAFSGVTRTDVWARQIDEQISERVVDVPARGGQAAGVEVVQQSLGTWRVEGPDLPAATAFEDTYGRVWDVTGFENEGRNRWRLEAARRIVTAP